MATGSLDLWTLTRGRPQIDPNDLAEAVAAQIASGDLCYRTRMLIKESVNALRSHWGEVKLQRWMSAIPGHDELTTILEYEFGEIGFPFLAESVMEKTEPDELRQLFEYLGRRLRKNVRIEVAGSVALIIPGYISRQTQDIDVIDEVPKEIREDHKLQDDLKSIYRLYFGHVQSHYFPMGWRERIHFHDKFDDLTVYLVDVYDVFLSKLFSARAKDMADLRLLAPQLDKDKIVQLFQNTCGSFLAAPRLKEIANDNWNVLFGEDLPHDSDTPTS